MERNGRFGSTLEEGVWGRNLAKVSLPRPQKHVTKSSDYLFTKKPTFFFQPNPAPQAPATHSRMSSLPLLHLGDP